jgi:cobalt-zinc-cadmium resistance protein CzcA
MFHPMAITVVLALTGAMLLSLTFVPAAIAMFLRGKVEEKETALMRMARALCAAAGVGAAHRVAVVAGALVLVVACGCWPRAGQRVHAQPRRGRHRAARAAHSRHQPDPGGGDAGGAGSAMRAVPRGGAGVRKIGTAEVATDPMPPSVADTFIMLKPRNDWPDPRKPKASWWRRSRRPSSRCPATTTSSPSRSRCASTS